MSQIVGDTDLASYHSPAHHGAANRASWEVPQIGIDDFSFRRGRKFGTHLVDLQTRKVLDVLPDRKAETSATWMSTHPEIGS